MLVLGFLLIGAARALLRCFGIHFAGDIERRTCVNCGVDDIEHKAVAQSTIWLLWEATHEHVARCGLPCGNGLKLSRREYVSSLSAIHNGLRCPRCGPGSP